MSMRSAAPLLCLALLGCDVAPQDEPPEPPVVQLGTTRSASIALLPDGVLVVTSPDDDRVVALDAETLEVLWRVEVQGEPTHVAFIRGVDWSTPETPDTLVITRMRHHAVATLQLPSPREPPTAQREIDTLTCAGTHGVLLHVPPWSPGRVLVTVTCPHDGVVVQRGLPLANGAIPGGGVWRSPDRPLGLARQGNTLAWTGFTGQAIHTIDLLDAATAPTGAEVEPLAPDLPEGFAASQVAALTPMGPGGAFTAVYQQVDHDSDRGRPPSEGGYGSVIDEQPRIEPRLWGDCAGRYAEFLGGLRVMSGPSDLAYAPATDTLWVAHQYTDNVVALGCAPGPDGLLPLKAVFSVGRGPRGLALSPDGQTAYVDVGFDHAVARLELPAQPVTDRALQPAAERRREVGEGRLSAEALKGRALFHDALNTHLTPSGIVTCATCHPHGAEDGLSWFLHTETVPRKLRRTPPVYNTEASLAPFHWDGEFDDAATLTRGTIHALMEGDGLLVDVEAIATYMAELPPPPARVDPLSESPGRSIFVRQGCAECHRGRATTDNEAHSVLTPSTDEDAQMARALTPSLRGVRTRPPYLHDGRAADLWAVLTAHNPDDLHGVTSTLSEEELGALVGYLESL